MPARPLENPTAMPGPPVDRPPRLTGRGRSGFWTRPGPVYADREEAGRRLADRLDHYARKGPTVLGIARGGVALAAVVADRLNAPLDVCVVRKVGAPGNPEYGLGAVAEGGIVVMDYPRAAELGLRPSDLELEIHREQQEVEDRLRRFRGGRPPAPVEGRTVLLVEDGLATGGTARAAVRALRVRRPERLVLAVGVSSPEARDALAPEVDEFVCPCVPFPFYAVGEWYRDFPQVSDEEVVRLLARPSPRAVEGSVDG